MFKTIKKAKNGDQDALLFLINKFKPLIKKYSRQLTYEETETDLVICFIEKIKKFNLNKIKNKNDAMIISYIHYFMEWSYSKYKK
ncbi:helix-turn-helix domain-containing protein [Dethiothermospora halolimnae]|uniref:helix-turn-helix domain-containing protein n=1 Tax=Dethiothermospora halolimnae TaxID=3114390 RepID=UPI003CCB8C6A